jgi:NadR type nicotinamide-nucleotide adenylyltransferase
MTRGLIIGKFYPFHNGHRYLIETAFQYADSVTVLVGDGPRYKIDAATRCAWIQDVFPEAIVRSVPEIVPDGDSLGWANYSREFLGYVPEMVFTSEDYGDPFAHYLGAQHILVDRARIQFPCSGTLIRADVLNHFEHLPPVVCAYFAKRIAVVGAESTGTTTLSRELAVHYDTVCVPEYGRLYWEGKVGVYTVSKTWDTREFVHIATAQGTLEDQLARSANRLVICDTDPLATALWHRRYLGHDAPILFETALARHYDLYILTGDEIPFVQDGTRDGEAIRHTMQSWFHETLTASGKPFLQVHGTREERLHTAIAAIAPLLVSPEF